MHTAWNRAAQEERREAERTALYQSWWRDWHRYLLAKATLLDHAATSAAPLPFEDGQDRTTEAETTLKRLAPDRRTVFNAAWSKALAEAEAAELGAARGLPLAPHAAERAALATLLAQCLGEEQPNGERWGEVPIEGGKWKEVRVDVLERPGAVDYITADPAENRRPTWIALGVVAAMIIGITLSWPRQASQAPTSSMAATVNGAQIGAWPLAAAVVHDAEGQTPLPLAATTGAWPQAGAAWRMSGALPLAVCLPRAQLRTAKTLDLVGQGDAPTRRYRLTDAPSADLHIAACDGSAERGGVLDRVMAPPTLALTEALTLADGATIGIGAVTVEDGTTDPAIPQGRLRVVVAVVAPTALDWAALQPRLVLASGWGAEVAPQIVPEPSGASVGYLVPSFTAPTAAQWQISMPDGTVRRWRTTLDPPPDRAAQLRAVQAEAHAVRAGTTVTWTVTLTHTGATPLPLAPADLALTQADKLIALPAIQGLSSPLTSGTPRTVRFAVQLAVGHEAVLTVGPARFRVRP